MTVGERILFGWTQVLRFSCLERVGSCCLDGNIVFETGDEVTDFSPQMSSSDGGSLISDGSHFMYCTRIAWSQVRSDGLNSKVLM